MVNEQKSALNAILYSCFHPSIFPEAKLNINELKAYFQDKGLLYTTLCDIIEKYDLIEATSYTIKTRLIKQGNRTEAEANSIVEAIEKAKTCEHHLIDEFKDDVKQLCSRAIITIAQREFPNDPVAYKKRIDEYQYRSLGSELFQVKDFENLPVESLRQELLGECIESSIPAINKSFAGGKGYHKRALVMLVGAPKRGKTMLLMQEASHFVKLGKKVHYLAIGDLNELDFAIRQSAQLLHESLDIVYSNPSKYHSQATKLLYKLDDKGEKIGKLSMTVMDAMTLTATNYYEVAKIKLSDYDVLIIDYDYNFQHESDSMYERGGLIYNLLAKLKGFKNQLIIVASQPNKSFWKDEILDEMCAGESSQKQMIIDAMITLGGYDNSGTHCGWINIPLQRRGKVLKCPYIRSEDGYIHQVPESLVYEYAFDKRRREFSYYELTRLIERYKQKESEEAKSEAEEKAKSGEDTHELMARLTKTLQTEAKVDASITQNTEAVDKPMSNE